MKRLRFLVAIPLILFFYLEHAVAEDKPPIMNNPLVLEQLQKGLLVDCAKWAMPIVSFFANKNAMIKDFKIEPGTVVYWSKPFGKEVKILTPNDTSLYFTTQIELFNGPVVVEIPPVHDSGLNFFGTLMTAWQTPIEDVGLRGFDAGKGGVYFITPPNYSGDIPKGNIHVKSNTYNVVAGFRVTPKSFSEKDLAAAAEYGKTMKLYAHGSNEKTKFFDAYGKKHTPWPPYDANYFKILHEAISTEPILDHDQRFVQTLSQFGIAKGTEFKEIPLYEAALNQMRSELREHFRRDMGYKMFPGSNWQLPVDLAVEAGSQFTYQLGSEYDWKRRALTFHWACWAPKYLGKATFYTLGQFDEKGEYLDGSKIYKLKVPADVPANQFWSVTMYNMNTYAFYDDVHTVAINNLQNDLKINADGTVDAYFSPTLPEGVNKGNWVPTKPGTEFFVLFRWYGPRDELFDGSWTMGDINKQ